MGEIAAQRLVVATDAEVLQEVLHRYISLQRFAEAVRMVNDLSILVPQIFPLTNLDASAAAALVPAYAPLGVKARDLVHAAIMFNHGLAEILTPDQHFDLIPGISRIDPLALYASGNPSPP